MGGWLEQVAGCGWQPPSHCHCCCCCCLIRNRTNTGDKQLVIRQQEDDLTFSTSSPSTIVDGGAIWNGPPANWLFSHFWQIPVFHSFSPPLPPPSGSGSLHLTWPRPPLLPHRLLSSELFLFGVHSSAAPPPDGLACARRLRSVSTTCRALLPPLPPHFAIRCTAKRSRRRQTPLWQSQIYLDSPPSAALYITPTKFGWTTNTLCYLDNYTLQFGQADFSKAYLPPLSRSLYCSCLNQLGRRSTASMEFGLFSKTSNILASACSSLLLLKSQLPILVRPSQFSAPPRFAQFVGGLPTTSWLWQPAAIKGAKLGSRGALNNPPRYVYSTSRQCQTVRRIGPYEKECIFRLLCAKLRPGNKLKVILGLVFFSGCQGYSLNTVQFSEQGFIQRGKKG